MFKLNRLRLRDIVFSVPLLKKIYSNKRKDLIPLDKIDEYLEIAEKVILDVNVNDVKVGLVKDCTNYPGKVRRRAYYPKFERFLKNNNIYYEYFDPNSHDWIEKAKRFDVIIWRMESDPSTQIHAESKVYTIQELLNIKIYPSFNELWGYENKINSHYQYKVFGLPSIPTFVSHSRLDAINYLEHCNFPIISKIATGSSSYGVEKLDNKKQAIKVVRKAFSHKGLKNHIAYYPQKDYVYFQEYIKTAEYDLRVICVGEKLFGYYRYPNKGDFRASGAGNFGKKEIPTDALELAYRTKNALKANCLATDMVFCKERKQFLIIETSIFIGVDTCEQLVIDGVPGVYIRKSEKDFIFQPGRYWVQELALKEFFLGIDSRKGTKS